jgi:hypothetical protein
MRDARDGNGRTEVDDRDGDNTVGVCAALLSPVYNRPTGVAGGSTGSNAVLLFMLDRGADWANGTWCSLTLTTN